ncbi:MAG: HAMP domain-containing histidine kinase, partial [Bacteroidetes bacterium]|nr:HAMP domain-containing histidine kinase [Bacteroidota bacterium]
NGSGISEVQKNNIFVPNFTTKTGGSGLGLSIVKNIIEGGGGEIWFTTEDNAGTEFSFYLPLLN